MDNTKEVKPQVGEIWLMKQPENDPDAWTLQVVILREYPIANAVITVPIIPDPAEAGPEDRILPRRMLGYDAAVSFELKSTISVDRLDSCQGCLSEKDFAALTSGELKRGMTYIDEIDHRYLRHAEICERITGLQSGLLEN